MTAQEVIRIIDEFVIKVDAGYESLMPDDPDRQRLEYLRNLLREAQRRLIERPPNADSPAFQDAAGALAAAAAQFAGPIHLDPATGENIGRFMDAVTRLTGIGGAKSAPPAALAGTDEPEVP
jgi:hypothetical protein